MARKASDETRSKELAQRDIDDIASLKSNAAFKRYFERRVLGELEKQREKVLYDRTLDCDSLWEEHQKFVILFDVSVMLLQDENACKRMFEAPED